MTHDELLANINNFIYSTNRLEDASQECDCAICKLQKSFNEALRAVVELHKPVKHCNNPKCPGPVCSECGSIETLQIEYPCPTIQAIEKELK